MELDDLKKSWNVLDEHLTNKEFIKDEDITRLISHAQNNIRSVNRFNRKLCIFSIVGLTFIALALVYRGEYSNIYFQILFIFCIPALCWDLFTTYYLAKTKMEERPLITTILRINRYHKWIIRERIIGVLFIVIMATLFFYQEQIGRNTAGTITFFIVWGIGTALALWIYRKQLERIKEIKKNLDELKELNHTT